MLQADGLLLSLAPRSSKGQRASRWCLIVAWSDNAGELRDRCALVAVVR